jgi:hypothetical protein
MHHNLIDLTGFVPPTGEIRDLRDAVTWVESNGGNADLLNTPRPGRHHNGRWHDQYDPCDSGAAGTPGTWEPLTTSSAHMCRCLNELLAVPGKARKQRIPHTPLHIVELASVLTQLQADLHAAGTSDHSILHARIRNTFSYLAVLFAHDSADSSRHLFPALTGQVAVVTAATAPWRETHLLLAHDMPDTQFADLALFRAGKLALPEPLHTWACSLDYDAEVLRGNLLTKILVTPTSEDFQRLVHGELDPAGYVSPLLHSDSAAMANGWPKRSFVNVALNSTGPYLTSPADTGTVRDWCVQEMTARATAVYRWFLDRHISHLNHVRQRLTGRIAFVRKQHVMPPHVNGNSWRAAQQEYDLGRTVSTDFSIVPLTVVWALLSSADADELVNTPGPCSGRDYVELTVGATVSSDVVRTLETIDDVSAPLEELLHCAHHLTPVA